MSIKIVSTNFDKSGKLSVLFCLIIALYLIGAVESVALFQKRHHGSPREVHCRNSMTYKNENCEHGSYIDQCKRELCYKDVGEKCSKSSDSINQFGTCAPGLTCDCGKCSGCNKHVCRLELNCENAIIYESD